MTKYRAKIKPLNAAKSGTEAHGYVEFTTEGDNLHIKLEMFDTPANIQHWASSTGSTSVVSWMARTPVFQLRPKTLTTMATLTYRKPSPSPGRRWCHWMPLPTR